MQLSFVKSKILEIKWVIFYCCLSSFVFERPFWIVSSLVFLFSAFFFKLRPVFLFLAPFPILLERLASNVLFQKSLNSGYSELETFTHFTLAILGLLFLLVAFVRSMKRFQILALFVILVLLAGVPLSGILPSPWKWVSIFVFAILCRNFWTAIFDSDSRNLNFQQAFMNRIAFTQYLSSVNVPSSFLKVYEAQNTAELIESQKSALPVLIYSALSKYFVILFTNFLRHLHTPGSKMDFETYDMTGMFLIGQSVLGGQNFLGTGLAILGTGLVAICMVTANLGFIVSVYRMLGFRIPPNNSHPFQYNYFHEFFRSYLYYYNLYLTKVFIPRTSRFLKAFFGIQNFHLSVFLALFLGGWFFHFIFNEFSEIFSHGLENSMIRSIQFLPYFFMIALFSTASVQWKRIRRKSTFFRRPSGPIRTVFNRFFIFCLFSVLITLYILLRYQDMDLHTIGSELQRMVGGWN